MFIQMKWVPGRKNHMSRHRRAECLQKTWCEGQGAMGINWEGQVWVNLGRTEKTMKLGYMKPLSSPACHSLVKRCPSKRGALVALEEQWLSMHGLRLAPLALSVSL